MNVNDHGGDCCGISHIMNFGEAPTEQSKFRLHRIIRDIIETLEENNIEESINGNFVRSWRGNFGHLIEIALTDQQMLAWAPELKRLGFKLCDRFKNDNSGNIVNLLTYKTKKTVPKKPYKW